MGLQQLLHALHTVKQSVPDIWLAIAGRGTLRTTLEQQVEELGLSNHVQFLGYLPDEQLPIAYQAADLTIVPSQALEGFGLILLESLACGTPVLATPVGGMPEVLQPFYPPLITESSDAAAIARRLISLFNGELSLPSSESCRDYVVSQFDWRIISQKVRDVLLTPLS
jgi:glycosyltransferase involved in cell wall biosynthesis